MYINSLSSELYRMWLPSHPFSIQQKCVCVRVCLCVCVYVCVCESRVNMVTSQRTPDAVVRGISLNHITYIYKCQYFIKIRSYRRHHYLSSDGHLSACFIPTTCPANYDTCSDFTTCTTCKASTVKGEDGMCHGN